MHVIETILFRSLRLMITKAYKIFSLIRSVVSKKKQNRQWKVENNNIDFLSWVFTLFWSIDISGLFAMMPSIVCLDFIPYTMDVRTRIISRQSLQSKSSLATSSSLYAINMQTKSTTKRNSTSDLVSNLLTLQMKEGLTSTTRTVISSVSIAPTSSYKGGNAKLNT